MGNYTGPTQYVEMMERLEREGKIPQTATDRFKVTEDTVSGPQPISSAQDAVRAAAESAQGSPETGSSAPQDPPVVLPDLEELAELPRDDLVAMAASRQIKHANNATRRILAGLIVEHDGAH